MTSSPDPHVQRSARTSIECVRASGEVPDNCALIQFNTRNM